MSGANKFYNVLMVDDEPAALELLSRRVSRHGYEVTRALSADEASDAVAVRVPDIILLDMNMPGVSGLELLRRLRRGPWTQTVPVIMVSAMDDTESIVTALKAGANDYVTKPIDMNILLARMETQLRLTALLMKMETQTQILSRLAAYDELTGVYNRRSLFDALEAEFSRTRRSGHHLSVLMVDVDFFKRINDTHGHLVGDEALKSLAGRLLRALRAIDVLGRYGGEEFCAVLPETNVEGSLRTAERVRHAISESPFSLAGADLDIPITISIGAATTIPGGGESPTELIMMADRALLEAKRTGRDRVCHPAQEHAS